MSPTGEVSCGSRGWAEAGSQRALSHSPAARLHAQVLTRGWVELGHPGLGGTGASPTMGRTTRLPFLVSSSYFFLLFKYLFIYLAAPGLSCSTRDLVP